MHLHVGCLRWAGLFAPYWGRGGTTLRAFCLSALWQIYETLHLLLRVQEWYGSPWSWATYSSALGIQTQQSHLKSKQEKKSGAHSLSLQKEQMWSWPWTDRSPRLCVLLLLCWWEHGWPLGTLTGLVWVMWPFHPNSEPVGEIPLWTQLWSWERGKTETVTVHCFSLVMHTQLTTKKPGPFVQCSQNITMQSLSHFGLVFIPLLMRKSDRST
jgi:hypothetical protein